MCACVRVCIMPLFLFFIFLLRYYSQSLFCLFCFSVVDMSLTRVGLGSLSRTTPTDLQRIR